MSETLVTASDPTASALPAAAAETTPAPAPAPSPAASVEAPPAAPMPEAVAPDPREELHRLAEKARRSGRLQDCLLYQRQRALRQ